MRCCCWRAASSLTLALTPSAHTSEHPVTSLRSRLIAKRRRHRSATTPHATSTSTTTVSACMQCSKNAVGDETRAIRCGKCGSKIHLACLKSAHYIEGAGWRSQDPPQYLSQLFNTPSFRFTCHTCIAKTPDDHSQHDSIASTVRTIEQKLDLLTNTMIGNILNDTRSPQQPQPTFAEVTAKAVARSIEESRPKEQPKPNSSDTDEIASALWGHIEKRQNDKTDSDDMKRTIVVTGAPYDDSHNPADRRRDDTAFAKELVTKLGIDSSTIQRVFRFRKRPTADRSPLMKVTFLTEPTRDDTLTEAKGLRDIPELSSVLVRPSLPQATRDHRDALYFGVTHTTINPNKIVRCVYNARVEEYELRFLYHDEERDFDRIDWQMSVPYSDADLAKWSAAVRTTRTTTTPADNSARGRRHGPATRNR